MISIWNSKEQLLHPPLIGHREMRSQSHKPSHVAVEKGQIDIVLDGSEGINAASQAVIGVDSQLDIQWLSSRL